MSRKQTIAALAALVLVVCAWGAPLTLRRMSFFRVRQVELIGVRYLAPDSVLHTLGLSSTQNLFDDLGAITERAAHMAGVVRATVDRRLPGTLRVIIVEQTPVAFAPGPRGLVPLDGAGAALPYNPAASGLDLPMIANRDTLVLQALAMVRMSDSTVFRDVDAARRRKAKSTDVVLDLDGRKGPRAVFGGVPTPDEVRAVSAVRRHLGQTGRPYRELDARYTGWVVVRRSTT